MKKIIQVSQNNTGNTGATDATNATDAETRNQITILNELFLNGCEPELATVDHKKYKQCITRKLMGYRAQDVANQIFDPRWFVEMEYVLELLVVSKLKCHYCRTNCAISYSKPRFNRQWTLDRLCNEQGHNRGNVVMACLKCNLHRGMKSSDKYKLGKQMKFTKTHTSSYDERVE
jgi:hypothetical protein